MFTLDVNCTPVERDVLIAELWEQGSTGIIEWDYSVRAFFDDAVDRGFVRDKFRGVIAEADDRNWIDFSREQLQPKAVGRRFFLVPEWRDDPAPESRIRITVNSGLAFGTGAHETTRLCLELIEDHVRPGATVVDVGTGSGILAEAAAHLGATRVVACDTDPDAIRIAVHNFTAARVPVRAFVGSAPALCNTCAAIIVANINPEWICKLADDWRRVLQPQGIAILSGIEQDDVQEIAAALKAASLTILQVKAEAEWRAIVATCAC